MLLLHDKLEQFQTGCENLLCSLLGGQVVTSHMRTTLLQHGIERLLHLVGCGVEVIQHVVEFYIAGELSIIRLNDYYSQ